MKIVMKFPQTAADINPVSVIRTAEGAKTLREATEILKLTPAEVSRIVWHEA